MADEPIEGQQVETTAPAQMGNEFQMPEKFAGKSAEDIAKSYTELENLLGERKTPAEVIEIKNELKELREAILSKNKPEVDEDEAVKNTKKFLDDMGYVKKDDLIKAQEQGRKEYELSRINSDLAKKYDGKDGRPAYNTQDIADYALKNGLQNIHPETVYELKHKAELLDWNIKQALKGNRAPIVPGAGKGAQVPQTPDYSKMKPEEVEAIAKENARKRIEAQNSSL